MFVIFFMYFLHKHFSQSYGTGFYFYYIYKKIYTMKYLKKIDCSLKDYKIYQKSIRNLGIGDELHLKIKTKENGFKDVFAYDSDGNIIGELFREESLEIFPFVSNSEKFEIKVNVKKFISKEEDCNAVVINIEIYVPDNFNEDEFLNTFSNSEKSKKIEFKNSDQSPIKNNKTSNGCLLFFLVSVMIVFLSVIFSKSSTNSDSNNDSLSINKLDSTRTNITKSKIDSSKINSLKQFFTEKKDEFSDNSWVKPKSKPYYINQNGFYCYFQKDASGNVSNFRFVGQYAAEDWLFIRYLKFNIDGKNYDFYPNEINTDNDTTIWEWFDDEITMTDYKLIEEISKAKSVKIRFEGRQYYDDKIMSQNNITSIKRTLEYYKAHGGSF